MKKYRHVIAMLSSLLVMVCFWNCKKVEEPVVTAIFLDTENVKKEYFQSEALDLSGIKVNSIYSDGRIIEVSDYETSMKTGDSFEKSGEIEITVSAIGRNAAFKIFVAEVQVISLSLNTKNVKKEYFQSEKLNLENLVVTANYSDGSKKDVTAYRANPVNETVLSVLGKNEITISYEGKSAVLEVEVIKNYISLISIKLPEYSDVTNLLVKDGNSFVAKEGCASYKWVLDGLSLSNPANIYTPDLSALKCGVHELMVIVKDAMGNSYSASATFVIEL